MIVRYMHYRLVESATPGPIPKVLERSYIPIKKDSTDTAIPIVKKIFRGYITNTTGFRLGGETYKFFEV